MKRLTALLLAALFVSGCGSFHMVDLGFAGSKTTAVKSIATPDQAEIALFIAAHAFHASCAAINLAHIQHRIGDAKYAELIGNVNSIADQTLATAQKIYAAIQAWKASGDRSTFDVLYSDLNTKMDALAKGAR